MVGTADGFDNPAKNSQNTYINQKGMYKQVNSSKQIHDRCKPPIADEK